MLKELKKAKQVFYRHHVKYPNAIYMTQDALNELKIEMGTKWKRLLSQVNGCVIFIDNTLPEPFEFRFNEELAWDDDET